MKFKIGQRVKVIKRAHSRNCSWVWGMNDKLGMCGKVTGITKYNNIRIKFDGDKYTFCYVFTSMSLLLMNKQLEFDFMLESE